LTHLAVNGLSTDPGGEGRAPQPRASRLQGHRGHLPHLLDAKGKMLVISGQDITYACPTLRR